MDVKINDELTPDWPGEIYLFTYANHVNGVTVKFLLANLQTHALSQTGERTGAVAFWSRPKNWLSWYAPPKPTWMHQSRRLSHF